MFVIEGRPLPNERPRHTRYGTTYTPKKTQDYEALVAASFLSSGDKKYLDGELLNVDMRFYFKVPKNYTRKQREELMDNPYYGKRPDMDNLEKAVLDGLNGVAYADDSQVVEKHSAKCYDLTGKGERVEVNIMEVR